MQAQMDISEYIKLAKNGDSQAFGFLYEAYSQKIFRYIKVKIYNEQQAEDLLQETFVKVWRGLPGFREEEGNFNSWIYRIAHNVINDYLRKIYRSPEAAELDDNLNMPTSENHGKDIDTSLALEKLKDLKSQLSLLYQQVLQLRFVEDLSLEETANILNKSNLAIRLIQHRAIKKLQMLIKENNANF